MLPKYLVRLITFCSLAVLITGVLANSVTAQDEILFTTALTVNPDGTRVALGRSPVICTSRETSRAERTDYAIQIFDLQTGQQVDEILGPYCAINDLSWSPDGSKLAISQNLFATAWIYDFDEQLFGGGDGSRGGGFGGGPESGGVAWSPDSNYYMNFSFGLPVVDVIDAHSYDLVATIDNGEGDSAAAMDWSNVGNFLAVANFVPNVQIWNMDEPSTPQLAAEHDYPTNVLDWHPTESVLALGIEDILLIDAISGAIQQTLTGHTDVVTELKWSPDGTRLASGGFDNTIRIWDAVTGEELAQYPVTTWEPAFDWTPDSTKFIYAIEDINSPNLFIVEDTPSADALDE